MKKYKYYVSIEWVETGMKFSMLTQLYQIGVYVCIYEGSQPNQFGADPKRLGRKQSKHIAALKAKGIDVTLGREITVYEDEQGFWKEYEEGQK